MTESQKHTVQSLMSPMPDNRVTAPSVHSYTVEPPAPSAENNFKAMRERTVGGQIKFERKEWGFERSADPTHEMAHIIMRLMGIRIYNASHVSEFFIVPLGVIIDETVTNHSSSDRAHFLNLAEHYIPKYMAHEKFNRTLLYAIHEEEVVKKGENARSVAEIWRSMHYEGKALIAFARTEYGIASDISLDDPDSWSVTRPNGTNYRVDESSSLPQECEGRYEEFKLPTYEEMGAFYDRAQPALKLIEDRLKGIGDYKDRRAALENIPMADLMDALGVEKLMVHKAGQIPKEIEAGVSV